MDLKMHLEFVAEGYGKNQQQNLRNFLMIMTNL